MRYVLKSFLSMFALMSVFSTNASAAAITAPDTTGIITDIGIVFGSVMAVYVVIFGFKKLLGFFR